MDSRIDTSVMDEIIQVGSDMQDLDLVNTFEGNLSIMKDGLLYITPGRTSKKKLNYQNICVFDEKIGEQINGGRPSSETKMHRGAYKVKKGINAVIHCHAPFLTAHAIANEPIISNANPELLFHYHDIPVVPYGQPGTDEIIEKAAPYLKYRNLVLLANHGVLSVASNLGLSAQRIISAEKLAKIFLIANLIGKPQPIPETEYYRLMGRPLDL